MRGRTGAEGAGRPARRSWLPVAAAGLMAGALLVGACSVDDDGGEPGGPEATVAEVVVSPDSAAVAGSGSTVQLEAEALDETGATVGGVDFSWSSTASGVAAVDDAGQVAAVGEGVAWIRASARGSVDSARVRATTAGPDYGDLLEGAPDGPLSTEAGWVADVRPETDGWAYLEGRLEDDLARAEELVVLEGVRPSSGEDLFFYLAVWGDSALAATNATPADPLPGDVTERTVAVEGSVRDYLDALAASAATEGYGGAGDVFDGTSHLLTWVGPDASLQVGLYGHSFDEFSVADQPDDDPDRTRYGVLADGWDLWAELF